MTGENRGSHDSTAVDRFGGWVATKPRLRRVGKRVASGVGRGALPTPLQVAAIDATRRWRRFRATADVFAYADPPDPFVVRRLDPARVERFSARVHPSWWGRRRRFGAVRGGDWDRRAYGDAPRHPAAPSRGERSLLYADRVVDSPLYRAIHARIRADEAWTDTEFVREVIERVESGVPVWHECRTRADVLERCEMLDRLAVAIREAGVRSQHELVASGAVTRLGVLHALSNEVVVDVGRDGSPLLVSGKHRLSIARALGVRSIPVAVCVRHRDRMRTRTTSHQNRDPGSGRVD